MADDVENAVILERVEVGNRRLDRLCTQMENLNGSLRAVQINQAADQVKIHNLTKHQDELRKVSNRNDGIVGGVVLSVVAAKELLKEILS